MKLSDYIEIASRRRWIIIITTMVALVVVSLAVIITPPTYQATTKLRIMTATSGGADYIQYDISYTERLMYTYVEIAQSDPVLNELKARMNVSELPDMTVEIIPNTELIQITIESNDASFAQNAANNLAEILIARSKELYTKASTESITIMEPAELPLYPAKPNKPLLILMGFVIGLFGGVVLALLFESLDTKLYTANQVEYATELPIIGDIPEDRYPLTNSDFLIDNRLHAEAFRRLRTNIFFSIKNKDLRSLMIASAVAGDGKSTIASNLALSASQTGRNVVLVDADLRNPSLHTRFNLDNQTGLTNVLTGEDNLEHVIKDTQFPGVKVLTSGPTPENPAEVLGLPKMAAVIKDLAKKFDIILIDVAGSLSVTDSSVIAPLVDGVALVVSLGWVRRGAIADTRRNLESVNARLIGAILNRTQRGVGTSVDKRLSTNHKSIVEAAPEEKVAIEESDSN
jgi:succinoglycan biosynthesis transport protein ExoP